ncbi:hypothetical protein [Sphingomonas hylomeconis]|uniref:Phage shock protein B n=1 Tax=Sphingomonas hylomeconis TaxID=1395958 RepID=A0ABV7SUJ6_9SPHN|nr:hypothetical protein [Sphingomonas hylomeconis]
MDNPFAMVVAIILIVTIGKVFTARYRHEKRGDTGETFSPATAASDAENQRLREELKSMKERLAVLERLATDSNDSGARLDREIERLRDRS